MMAGLLALAAASWSVTVWIEIPPSPAALAAAAAADPDEVIVNGTRLRRTELRVRTDRRTGVAGCAPKRASGDPALDADLCRAALSCNVAPIRAKALEACMMSAVGATVRARYPDRAVAPDVPSDKTR